MSPEQRAVALGTVGVVGLVLAVAWATSVGLSGLLGRDGAAVAARAAGFLLALAWCAHLGLRVGRS